MTELKNGDLYLVYYGGAGEYAIETAVFGSRLKRGETKWSDPKPIAHDPFRSVGNGVIWEAPDGARLALLRRPVRRDLVDLARPGQGLARRRRDLVRRLGAFARRRNDGPQPADRPEERRLPACRSTTRPATTPKRSGPTARRSFCDTSPRRRLWTKTGPIRSPKGNIQPAVVELDDNHLIAYCRRGGDYDPKTIGYIVRAESHDGGLTWSEGKDSAFPNPNAAVEFLKLQSGRLLLIFNDSMNRRTPLTAALSTDQDRTWTSRRNIREGDGDFGYPSAFQARDGRIHLVFTSDRRTVVNHAVFDEDWVIHGR